jgi:hypothetical protein
VAWRNEYIKEQTSSKRVAEEAKGRINGHVEFNVGEIKIGNESYVDWKVVWKKLKNIIREGKIRNKVETFREKRLQSEIPMGFDKDDHGWLKCNTDPRKNSIDIPIAGTDDRNKSMEENERTIGPRQVQIVWGI